MQKNRCNQNLSSKKLTRRKLNFVFAIYQASKLKISDAAFTRSYSEAKAALDALRKGKISETDFKTAMGKAPEIAGQRTIESSLL